MGYKEKCNIQNLDLQIWNYASIIKIVCYLLAQYSPKRCLTPEVMKNITYRLVSENKPKILGAQFRISPLFQK